MPPFPEAFLISKNLIILLNNAHLTSNKMLTANNERYIVVSCSIVAHVNLNVVVSFIETTQVLELDQSAAHVAHFIRNHRIGI